MNMKRTAVIVSGGTVLAVWLASAATSGNREVVAPVALPVPEIDVRGDALASEIDKLHEHLRPSAVPRQPGRNLFTFAAREVPRAAPAPALAEVKPALSEAASIRPPAPALKLSGIAEDEVAGATVRTAIISGGGQLYLVKEGESVTARYRVAKISSDVVELSDLTGGAALRLALK
jgi:hypothetical protein